MVYQNLSFLEKYFDATVHLGDFENLFARRARGEAIRLSNTIENSFLDGNQSIHERIRRSIREWKAIEAKKIELDLNFQNLRLENAIRRLEKRLTVTAQKERDTADRQIRRLLMRRDGLTKEPTPIVQGRIFPFDYTPVLIEREGMRILTPMRYHLRPPDMREDFDRKYPGCYNARKDQLTGFWQREFGKKHAALLISSFYENVRLHVYEKRELRPEENEQNQIISFQAKDHESMLISCLYDIWGQKQNQVQSFAIITDDPPPEVTETGHDRCPIFIQTNHLNSWLNPAGKTGEALLQLLTDKENTSYIHAKG